MASMKLINTLPHRATNKNMLRQPNFLSAMSVVKLEENRGGHKRFSTATWEEKTCYQDVTAEAL